MEIINATNKTDIGHNGKIIDETKNMIIIETKKGNKKFIKNAITFKIKNSNEKQG